jgi:hypothetical protein
VVEDALTGALTTRIDDAVSSGKITEAQGAKAKEKVGQVVDRILDADGSRLGQRHARAGGLGQNLRQRLGA